VPFTAATMGRREATVTDLVAQAESNGYKRGAHKEKDMVHGRGKHVKKTKKNQDATLKLYVLYEETALLGRKWA
jgi:hypothetical protein